MLLLEIKLASSDSFWAVNWHHDAMLQLEVLLRGHRDGSPSHSAGPLDKRQALNDCMRNMCGTSHDNEYRSIYKSESRLK